MNTRRLLFHIPAGPSNLQCSCKCNLQCLLYLLLNVATLTLLEAPRTLRCFSPRSNRPGVWWHWRATPNIDCAYNCGARDHSGDRLLPLLFLFPCSPLFRRFFCGCLAGTGGTGSLLAGLVGHDCRGKLFHCVIVCLDQCLDLFAMLLCQFRDNSSVACAISSTMLFAKACPVALAVVES